MNANDNQNEMIENQTVGTDAPEVDAPEIDAPVAEQNDTNGYESTPYAQEQTESEPSVEQNGSKQSPAATATPSPHEKESGVESTAEEATAEEPPAEPSPAEIIAQLEQKLAEAEAKADGYRDQLQRTAAEFQNSRRRQEKQVAERIERASAHLIERLLPVLDDLDLAFRNIPAEVDAEHEAWLTGFRQIQKKLLHIVEEEDVSPIPLTGAFDPSRHEAVSSEPSDEVESGHIIETLRIGYEHKGRVLRPALVRVAM
jgi:molecular chaperone GrpE